jgi:hypothetical protein
MQSKKLVDRAGARVLGAFKIYKLLYYLAWPQVYDLR